MARKSNPHYGKDALTVGALVLMRPWYKNEQPTPAKVRGCSLGDAASPEAGILYVDISWLASPGDPPGNVDSDGYVIEVCCHALASSLRLARK